MSLLQNARGFTVVEALVVTAIIGTLAAVAIPSYLTYVHRARQGEAKLVLTQAYLSEQALFSVRESYSYCLKQLGLAQYLEPKHRYYAVGFSGPNLNSTLCGKYRDTPCTAYAWDNNFQGTAQCFHINGASLANDEDSDVQFAARITAGSQVAGDLDFWCGNGTGNGDPNTWCDKLDSNTFIIGAGGFIAKDKPADRWTIDQKREIRQITSGI